MTAYTIESRSSGQMSTGFEKERDRTDRTQQREKHTHANLLRLRPFSGGIFTSCAPQISRVKRNLQQTVAWRPALAHAIHIPASSQARLPNTLMMMSYYHADLPGRLTTRRSYPPEAAAGWRPRKGWPGGIPRSFQAVGTCPREATSPRRCHSQAAARLPARRLVGVVGAGFGALLTCMAQRADRPFSMAWMAAVQTSPHTSSSMNPAAACGTLRSQTSALERVAAASGEGMPCRRCPTTC
jgi:hypothetical protein